MFRVEEDSLGSVRVPEERLWGAQTQRSSEYFRTGPVWGRTVIRALGIVKLSAAAANLQLGQLSRDKADAIQLASREAIEGRWDAEFPLVVFQTGSGTQTNMNANEVIANRAMQLSGDRSLRIHPNDDVNRGQSSNDVFPAVMHIATVHEVHNLLLPAVRTVRDALEVKGQSHRDLVMLGRTHLQDAVPITFGQVVSGWVAQLDQAMDSIVRTLPALYELALGGTAVGTGVQAHPRFGALVAQFIAGETGQPFVTAPNKFAALSAHDAMVNASAALRTLAGALMKIANDVRWYASGPRAGLGELILPANEPGSSIMPGKINPTQVEALTMVAVQVFGNDHAVAFAGSQGNFQLNVYKPVILHNVLTSIELLASACRSFTEHCVKGMEPDESRIGEHVRNSLQLVTALSSHIGYEKSAAIALRAHRTGMSLRDAAMETGYVRGDQFDLWVRPEQMVAPAPQPSEDDAGDVPRP